MSPPSVSDKARELVLAYARAECIALSAMLDKLSTQDEIDRALSATAHHRTALLSLIESVERGYDTAVFNLSAAIAERAAANAKIAAMETENVKLRGIIRCAGIEAGPQHTNAALPQPTEEPK